MAKVFAYYSRKDIEFAKRLTAEFQKPTMVFWININNKYPFNIG